MATFKIPWASLTSRHAGRAYWQAQPTLILMTSLAFVIADIILVFSSSTLFKMAADFQGAKVAAQLLRTFGHPGHLDFCLGELYTPLASLAPRTFEGDRPRFRLYFDLHRPWLSTIVGFWPVLATLVSLRVPLSGYPVRS
ncbi:uncharacterized protein BDW70DRAFT_24081 [Aspergillus foveolatus]|uniref:uncharacterized protein n=1 Tax=Aspergillus foveolatus TaxID=210207 RepID=UPI003CCCB75C